MTNALMVVGAVEGDMNDRDFHHERRPRSQIPGCQRGRSKSPGLRRNMSPIREGSAGRRANIEQWNLERERKSTDNGWVHSLPMRIWPEAGERFGVARRDFKVMVTVFLRFVGCIRAFILQICSYT
ncbi:hypothetical protein AMTRI_Chr05g61200 [Amborella trichopoda]